MAASNGNGISSSPNSGEDSEFGDDDIPFPEGGHVWGIASTRIKRGHPIESVLYRKCSL